MRQHHTARLPFGKFSGQRITEVESWYLTWLVEQPWLRTRYGLLRRAILDELERRDDDQTADAPEGAGDCIVIPRPRFNQWFRKLTARFHPDVRGGSHDAMQALNVARDELVALADGGRS